MSRPKNWPESMPYLKAPLHDKDLSKAQIETLRTRPASVPSAPASATQTPSAVVKIQTIREASHPAHGQHGLFAAQNLKPGALIVAYLGRVHGGEGEGNREESDYDLWLDREADLAVDAASEGNEGRYVNDYRGVRERANAEFGPVWCERWGQLCIGIWVMGGKKNAAGIKKGEEILVSYGKGFWGERQKEGG